MAKNNNNKKTVKVVKTTRNLNKDERSSSSKRIVPTSSSLTRNSSKDRSSAKRSSVNMIFGSENYKMMVVGLAFVVLGFVLMSGGAQPDDSWNPEEIYSFRRTVLAPFLILVGLVVEIFAIFKK